MMTKRWLTDKPHSTASDSLSSHPAHAAHAIGCSPLPTLSPSHPMSCGGGGRLSDTRANKGEVAHNWVFGGPDEHPTDSAPALYICASTCSCSYAPHTWSLLDTPSQRRVFAVAVVAQKTEPESRLRRIQGRKLAHRPALGIPLPSIQIFFARRYRVGGLVPPPQCA